MNKFILFIIFGTFLLFTDYSSLFSAINNFTHSDSTILYDWNGDSIADTFLIKNYICSSNEYDGNTYSDLAIKMSNGNKFTLSKHTKLQKDDRISGINYNSSEADSLFNFKNKFPNNLIWLVVIIPNSHPMLMISLKYPEETGNLIIISLDKNTKPKLINRISYFDIVKIADLDGDSIGELVGFICWTQTCEYNENDDEYVIQTYDPNLVYRFDENKFSYSEMLSKNFNISSGYGWAGKECSEEVEVLLNTKTRKRSLLITPEEFKKARELIYKNNKE